MQEQEKIDYLVGILDRERRMLRARLRRDDLINQPMALVKVDVLEKAICRLNGGIWTFADDEQ